MGLLKNFAVYIKYEKLFRNCTHGDKIHEERASYEIDNQLHIELPMTMTKRVKTVFS
jgi:hypothetical protein